MIERLHPQQHTDPHGFSRSALHVQRHWDYAVGRIFRIGQRLSDVGAAVITDERWLQPLRRPRRGSRLMIAGHAHEALGGRKEQSPYVLAAREPPFQQLGHLCIR